MKVILHFVLGVRAAVRDGRLERLRPEIFRVGGVAAEFERDEMILFVVSQAGIGVAIFGDLLDFQAMRVVFIGTDGFRGPPWIADRLADIFLGDVRIDRAGRASAPRWLLTWTRSSPASGAVSA